MKRLLLFTGVFFLASTTFAANVAGKWVGRMSLDSSAIKKELQRETVNANPVQKQDIENRLRKIDASVQMVAKNVIKMDLQKGGVVVVDFMRNGKSEPERGRWSQKGKRFFLMNLTGGGDSKLSLEGKVIDAGKTIVFDMSHMMIQEMKAKGLKATVRPKLTLSFKKA